MCYNNESSCTSWISLVIFLPHTPVKIEGHRWPWVAQCGLLARRQKWEDVPSFLKEKIRQREVVSTSHLMHCTVTAGSESVSFELRRAWHKEVLLAPWCDMIPLQDLCWNMLWPLTYIPQTSSVFLFWGVILVQKTFPCHCLCLWTYQGYILSWNWENVQPVCFYEERGMGCNREDLSLGFQWLRINEQDWDA